MKIPKAVFMKRFEVEFEKDVYWIVSFERSKRKHMFSYIGEVHVSPDRTAEANRRPLFFSFEFSRTEAGWDEMGELEIKAQPDATNDMLEVINDLLIQGIKEFEGLK
jgi:hypothetical protein